MQLQGEDKFLLLETASCGLHFFECSASQTTCDPVQVDVQDIERKAKHLMFTLSSNLATPFNFLLPSRRS